MVTLKCKTSLLRILAYSEGRSYEEVANMYGDPELSVDLLYQLKDLKLITFNDDLWTITIEGYVVMRLGEEPHHACKPTKAGPLQHTGSGTYKGESPVVGREGALDFLGAPSRYGERLEPLSHVHPS